MNTLDNLINELTEKQSMEIFDNLTFIKNPSWKEETGEYPEDEDVDFYETYNPDLAAVLQYAKEGKGIYTKFDDDDGDIAVESGYHLCNRIGYYVTEEPQIEGVYFKEKNLDGGNHTPSD
jgi:hypothetical protein